jgi:hypothetical protein
MSVAELLESLAEQRYRPPLAELCEDLRSIPEVLRIPILIIDFDIEIQMNGILGFLENLTGRYLADTIDALDTVAARDTAKTLRAVNGIMIEHGVTFQRLRNDFAKCQEFDITSFSELHGEELSQMADLIDQEARKLYIYDAAGEAVFELLSAYLEGRRDEFAASLDAYSAPDGASP